MRRPSLARPGSMRLRSTRKYWIPLSPLNSQASGDARKLSEDLSRRPTGNRRFRYKTLTVACLVYHGNISHYFRYLTTFNSWESGVLPAPGARGFSYEADGDCRGSEDS